MSNLAIYLNQHFPASKALDGSFVNDERDSPEDDQPRTGPSKEKGAVKFSSRNMKTSQKKVETEGPVPPSSDFQANGWTNLDLRRHFMETFGVSVRIVGSYFLFKYYVILQGKRWDSAVLSDCRGTIVKKDESDGWKVSCRPFEKFFNQQEKHCQVHTAAEFNKVVGELELVEKADGTMVAVWWRDFTRAESKAEEGCWQISTQTVIEATAPWPALVQQHLNLQNTDITASLDRSRSYIFELCSKENHIITTYPEDRLYLLGAIHNGSGEYLPSELLDTLASSIKVHRPIHYSAKALKLTSLAAVLAWVESQASDASFGKDPEGFVAFYLSKPLCKFKNRAYYSKHDFYADDLLHMRNLIIDRFFEKTTDDVLYLCPPAIVAFLEELQGKVEKKIEEAVEAVERIKDPANLPEFKELSPADLIATFKSKPKVLMDAIATLFQDQMTKSFLIKVKTSAMEGGAEVRTLYLEWLDRAWSVYREYWKETKVAEIIHQIETNEKFASARKPVAANVPI